MFEKCNSLKNIDYSKIITNKSDSFKNMFNGCVELVHIEIPKSVTSISLSAFSGCNKLKEISYEGSETEWSSVAIGGSNAPLTTQTIHFDNNGGTPSHAWRVYEYDDNHTCVSDGTETATCTFCNLKDVQTVQGTMTPDEHSFTVYVSDNNATCVSDGTKTATCDHCSETDTITDIGSKATAAHRYIDGKCVVCHIADPNVEDSIEIPDKDVDGDNMENVDNIVSPDLGNNITRICGPVLLVIVSTVVFLKTNKKMLQYF